MDYLVNGHKYKLSYRQLKEHYNQFCDMTDEEFLKNLPGAAHLACIICFIKEIPTSSCLNDEGIIHQLIHLIDIPSTKKELPEIREEFRRELQLV
jgi:hypothetical protein